MIASLVDSQFKENYTAANGKLQLTSKLKFDRSSAKHRIKFFTDTSLDKATTDKTPIKIGWLLEAPGLYEGIYEKITDVHLLKYFSFVLTHNKKLLDTSDKFLFCPFGGTWIVPEEWKIYPKTKSLSIVASSKSDLDGHKLRHSVIDQYRDRINDIMGTGYSPFDNKIDSVKDFRYSIVIENCREDYWFTEKLIDCFATGTVPIYWGCPSISDFFNIDGIIPFSRVEDLNDIIDRLSENDYKNREYAIKDNLERAKKYAITEDYIVNCILPSEEYTQNTLKMRRR